MENERSLRILFVEDFIPDMEMAVRTLKSLKCTFDYKRVETKENFLSALDEFKPDIIISDYSMPLFDGMQALKLSLECDPFMPFIILTGSMNEDTAVACLKAGATDYVIKEHLARLPFAVNEAMEHFKIIKEKEATAKALRESEQNYRTLADSGQALIWTSGTDKLYNYFNKTWFDFRGRKPEQELGNGWIEGVHRDDVNHCLEIYHNAFEKRVSFSREYRIRRCDGKYRWIQDDGKPRYNEDGDFIGYIGQCLDITERKKAEEQILRALKEKEVMLKEIHHRVKNNMQLICSLLELQALSITDKTIKAMFEESVNRIRSMAMIHEKLYQSNELAFIDFKEYLRDLVRNMADTYLRNDIEYSISTENIFTLTINEGIPCGLIVNELVSNSFKHAFPGGKTGAIRVELNKNENGDCALTVADNGIGFPDDIDVHHTKSLGLQLINVLVVQLGGTLNLSRTGGSMFRITFPQKAEHRY